MKGTLDRHISHNLSYHATKTRTKVKQKLINRPDKGHIQIIGKLGKSPTNCLRNDMNIIDGHDLALTKCFNRS